jgi:hypothetical protein
MGGLMEKQEELTVLTDEEQDFVDGLDAGYHHYCKCLDGDTEEKVITYVKSLGIDEFGDNCGQSVFITHGQDLKLYLAKGFEDDPKEFGDFADKVAERLRICFGLNFTVRSYGARSFGMIVDEEQTLHYYRNNN